MCFHFTTLGSLVSNLPFLFAVRRNKVFPKPLVIYKEFLVPKFSLPLQHQIRTKQ